MEISEFEENKNFCPCCNGTGYVEGEEIEDKLTCLTCNGRGVLN